MAEPALGHGTEPCKLSQDSLEQVKGLLSSLQGNLITHFSVEQIKGLLTSLQSNLITHFSEEEQSTREHMGCLVKALSEEQHNQRKALDNFAKRFAQLETQLQAKLKGDEPQDFGYLPMRETLSCDSMEQLVMNVQMSHARLLRAMQQAREEQNVQQEQSVQKGKDKSLQRSVTAPEVSQPRLMLEVPASAFQKSTASGDSYEMGNASRHPNPPVVSSCSRVRLQNSTGACKTTWSKRDAWATTPRALQEALGWRAPTEEPQKTMKAERWLNSIAPVLICLNCIYAGVKVQMGINYARDGLKPPLVLRIGDWVFAPLFMLELFYRIVHSRCRFCGGPEWRWHWFDICVVSTMLVDLVFGIVNLGYMRGLCLLRSLGFMRGFCLQLRSLRLQHCTDQLHVMMLAVINAMDSLFWASVLLACLLYLCALTIMETLQLYLLDEDPTSFPENLMEYYGSIYLSMLSLFMAVTGGRSWGEVLKPLRKISEWYVPFFIFYIGFVVLGLLNVLVAIFVQTTRQTAEREARAAMRSAIQGDDSPMDVMRRILLEASTEGRISSLELESQLDDPEIQTSLRLLGLDASEARGLFRLVDVDGIDSVSIEEFLTGMARLKGQAIGADEATAMYESKRIICRLMASLHTLEERICALSDFVGMPRGGGQ